MADFAIGDFTFETFHEYREGQEDLKKIEAINNELDIQDPEVALRLYNLIRDGQIAFHTAIGDDFSAHIADIVAEKSQGLLEDEEIVQEAKEQVRYQRLAGIATAAVALALFTYYGITQYTEWHTARKISALRDTVAESSVLASDSTDGGATTSSSISNAEDATLIDGTVETGSNDTNAATKKKKDPFQRVFAVDPASLTVLPEYRTAFSQNEDLIGWLTIPETVIDYPVMQKKKDNEFYLDHGFDGSNDSAGSLFMDYRSDAINPTTNTIIYGHNMNNGSMFGQVKNYLDEDYYNAHRSVQFDTIYEKRRYEVVAVCLSEVAYQDESSYRYYNFIQASNQAQWDAFVSNVRELSVFGTDVDLKKTDEVLTLSTCNNYTQDGRLFLVAKRTG